MLVERNGAQEPAVAISRETNNVFLEEVATAFDDQMWLPLRAGDIGDKLHVAVRRYLVL